MSYIYKSLLMAVEQFRCPPCSSPHISMLSTSAPGNKLIAITKVKKIISYKDCKCDYSIAIGACGVTISQEVVTLARMRELHINMEYGTGARGYILKRCQEPHFNFCLPTICSTYVSLKPSGSFSQPFIPDPRTRTPLRKSRGKARSICMVKK
jgi:hypothetical protein